MKTAFYQQNAAPGGIFVTELSRIFGKQASFINTSSPSSFVDGYARGSYNSNSWINMAKLTGVQPLNNQLEKETKKV